MLECRVNTREQDFVDARAVLIDVETPTAGLSLTALHQLVRNILRMINRPLPGWRTVRRFRLRLGHSSL
jgi:hypothetical protein